MKESENTLVLDLSHAFDDAVVTGTDDLLAPAFHALGHVSTTLMKARGWSGTFGKDRNAATPPPCLFAI